MKRTILLILFFTTILNSFSQLAKNEISYFSAREYGKGHEASNWACVQDKNGVLYFGNAGGLLQYDGTNWNFIKVKDQSSWVKSLSVSNDNIIYIGAQNEFGYLAPDAAGKLLYVSLSDKLEKNQKEFKDIIHVWAWKNKVAFQAEEAIFIYSNNKLTTIIPETSFHLSFLVNDELYVRQRDIGIMKLEGNKLQLIKGSEFFKNFGVFSILKSSEPNKFILITREDGFWTVNKNTFEASAIKTKDSTLFKQAVIYGSIKLKDGNIALNTLSNGIIITDEHFNIISIFNKDNGLKVNGVLALMQDYEENIWAGLDNGISQIKYSSPVSIFGSETGIFGNIKAVLRYKGKLFIGSTDGLYIQQEKYNQLSSAFKLYNGLNKEVKNLCIADGSLIVGTPYGLFEINNEQINLIADVDVSTLYYSEKLKLLFVAEKNNFVLFQHSGKWKKLIDIPEITEEIIRFEEEYNTNGTTLWMGTPLQGIVRLQYTNPSKYVVDKYNSSDGLIENSWVLPFKINNKVVFAEHSGFMQFVNEETLKKQLPDSLKNKPEFYRGYFDFYNIDSLKARLDTPFYAIEDTKDRIYANLDNSLGYFDKSHSLSWITQPFCLADIGKTNLFFHEADKCWIGGDDGLIQFDEKKNKNYLVDFNTIITMTSSTGDSILYSGYSEIVNNLQQNKQLTRKFVLDYSLNNMYFQFAAPFYDGQEKMLYSYILLGQDTAYSIWQKDNKVSFTNLREGEYIFKVKAKNIYGHISSESVFKFTILSPWYRKIWAYFLYVILFIALIYAGIRFNTRRLVAINKRLELTIRNRTAEIRQQNIKLQEQKEEILDSINYALRIQQAVLPDEELTKKWLGEYFILFRPKDIVSGDFYWATKINDLLIVTVADCTGHGVPGAFMSMLGISFLNEIVRKKEIIQASEVLDHLRESVIDALKQSGAWGEQKDGMDLVLVVINTKTLELQFAGANNPLWIVRKTGNSNKEEFEEYKPDKMPVAIYENMKPFTNHIIQLYKDDIIFLASDGYEDQFGGPKYKKFLSKNLKQLLFANSQQPMTIQKDVLEQTLNDWKGNTEQIDDITIMGIKI